MKGKMVSTWKMSYTGLCQGMKLLEQSNIHDAIVHTIKNVEDNPDYESVGFGGLPNFDGEVELDAAYMNGDTLGVGGIISVKNIKNPIEVAYDLSKYKRNCILAGDGAMRYAKNRGFIFTDMLTEKATLRYQSEKKQEIDMELLEAYGGHDTVCVIGKDNHGTIACGVSTSGLFLKLPGRVGDSPIIGSGFYADSAIGAVAATGVGEDILKGCLSFAIIDRMKLGLDVQSACQSSLQDHIDNLSRRGYKVGSISVIAMDKNCNIGAATNKKAFPFVVGGMDDQCIIYVASNELGVMKVWKPDKFWLEKYLGD